VLVLENGSTAVLDASGLRQTESVPHGKVPIAIGGERLDKETLWRRAELGRAGIVTVSLVLDRQGRLLAGPEISSIGVPLVDRELSLKRGLARALLKTLERVRDWRGVDLSDELRRSVRKQVFDACGCRPTVEVHLLTANG
jgi:mRNA degradation ribonuclease J1/J2